MQPDRPRVETNIIAETSVMASGGAAPGNWGSEEFEARWMQGLQHCRDYFY